MQRYDFLNTFLLFCRKKIIQMNTFLTPWTQQVTFKTIFCILTVYKTCEANEKGHENHSLCQINDGMLHSHKHKLQIGKASHPSAIHLPTNYRQIAYK